MTSLHTHLAALLASGDRDGARRVCVLLAAAAPPYAELNQAASAAAHYSPPLTDVVQLLCSTSEAAQRLRPETIAHVLVHVSRVAASAQTAAIVRAVFAIPSVGTTSKGTVRMILLRAVSWDWVQGLEACCANSSLRTAVTLADLEAALHLAVKQGSVHAIRLLCSPRLLAFGVQPLQLHPSLLERAAQRPSPATLALLGEVVSGWAPSDVQVALAAAATGNRVPHTRILCAPPFAARVYGVVPNPLVVAAESGSAAVMAVLLAMLPAPGGDAATAATVSRNLGCAMETAVGHAQVPVLRHCFSYMWRVRRSHLSPSDLVRISVTEVVDAHDWGQLFTIRGSVRTALACLHECPGGDSSPTVATLTTLLARVKRTHRLADTTWDNRRALQRLQRELESLVRWRSRRTLLCLRRLRDVNRAQWVTW